MPPPEISKRVLDAKLEACKFAFLKLSAVKTTRMKNYKQLRTLLMLKEISRRGADRDFLKDPENSVTRILCSVLKQVVSNSNRSLKSLRGFHYETLDDQEKQQVTRMIASVQGMGSRKYESETVDHLDDMTEPMEREIYLGNGDDSVGGDFSDIVLEPISWPLESQLTLEWVETLMGLFNQFTWKNSVSEFPLILPHSVAVSLVDCALRILDKEANCVEINCCSENSRVIVVGDLHGQLHDLLKIFDQSGRPSQNQRFVFNGNYIGRGSWSLEVFLVLLAWKILMPESVFLLRGSSETRVSAEELDFLKDICDRYGEHGPMLYSKCIDCFKMLPLASVISNSVYTTHGGLFQSSLIHEDSANPSLLLGSLEELDKIERRQAGENDDENITVNHVLWSCPWMADGLSESNYKGLLWGADCTETFLKQSNLKLQHQIISDGSSTQQQQMWENRTGHGFASMGISNPPSWTVPLPNDPSQILQLREAPQVFEGLPLPETIEEPHKSNYDYLFRLISALKQEIQTRDNREKELVMEQCIVRLDVAMFNAILRESAHHIPSDTASDPIADPRVLPIPAGVLSFESGVKLKNTVYTLATGRDCFTDIFEIDGDHSLEEEKHMQGGDGAFKLFHLLNELSDLLMLPKEMLVDSSTRDEVCPSIGLSLIKRILCNFTPDDFCPYPVPGTVLEELNTQCILESRSLSGDATGGFPRQVHPVSYCLPSCSHLTGIVAEFIDKFKLSMTQNKGYGSNKDVASRSPAYYNIIKGAEEKDNLSFCQTNERYRLLGEA